MRNRSIYRLYLYIHIPCRFDVSYQTFQETELKGSHPFSIKGELNIASNCVEQQLLKDFVQ